MKQSIIQSLEKKGFGYDKTSGLLTLEESATLLKREVSVPGIKPVEKQSKASNSTLPTEIYPLIRAMTCDKVTHNSTYYPREELIGEEGTGTGVKSWLYPYARPVILDHNESGGFFGGEASTPLGRIYAAGVLEGDNYLSLVPKIVDKDAIEKVLNGTYLTCSIGVSVETALCSICGCNLREDYCDHMKGYTYQIKQSNGSYKEEKCYYIMKGIRAREISFVNTPSDDEAMVLNKDLGEQGLKTWTGKKGIMSRNESVDSTEDFNSAKGWWFAESSTQDNLNMNTETNTETKESVVEFTSADELLKEANALIELQKEGTDVDEARLSRFTEAWQKSGFSENHKVRIISTELEGMPILPKDVDITDVTTENEEVKNILEKIKISEGQVDLSLAETLLVIDEVIEGLNTKSKSLEEANVSLTSDLELANTRIEELSSTKDGENLTKLEEANTQLEAITEAYKSLLVKFTATESIRAGRGFTKGKSLDEVVATLSTRTESSLHDTLNDLIEETGTNPLPSVEKLSNPLSDTRETSSNTRVIKDVSSFIASMAKNKADDKEDDIVDESVEEKLKVVYKDGYLQFVTQEEE